MSGKAVMVMVSFLLLGLAVSCASPQPPALAPTPSPPLPHTGPTPPPPAPVEKPTTEAEQIITEIGKDLAISEMVEGFTDVLDAAIVQHGDQVSLALIVPTGTSQARAKELGFHFACALIEYELGGGSLEGMRPYPNWETKEIGKGIFDYLVTVATPDQTVIVQGAKVSSNDHITWQ